MTTFNGKHENLKFRCAGCGYSENTSIIINPECQDDMINLGNWLLQHSASGGKYVTVPAAKAKREVSVEEEVADVVEKVFERQKKHMDDMLAAIRRAEGRTEQIDELL